MTPSGDTVSLELFSTLRKIGPKVAIEDLASHQVHYGEDYQDSTEDWARALRNLDAPFTWLAYSFGDIPMWELHVGVVLLPDRANVGFHAHMDAAPELLDALHELGSGIGPAYESEAAREMQYNEVFIKHGEFELTQIARVLSRLYSDVRTQLHSRELIEKAEAKHDLV